MKEQVVIITGANRGIGKEAAKQIAKSGAKVYLACRSLDSANQARDEIINETKNKNVFVRYLDLESVDSIIKFADQFNEEEKKLDVLINNAGIWTKTKKLTELGVERTFAVNVLGHQLLTHLLLDQLKSAAPSRIINVASHYAGGLDIDDINFEKRSYNETIAYKQTKQANRMLTREWARRLEKDNIKVYSMTPGFVPSTELFREQNAVGKFLLKVFALIEGRTIEEGADTIFWLATSEKVDGNNGGFFNQRKEEKCKFDNIDEERRLWDKCEEFLSKVELKESLAK
ncbi:MAG: SDR family NAD(P)-dependent oxidoreductase [Ignavibacterium sp.]|nr:SDR family NAD(P)-dependent oxidoreductase [Ignavibacterium sp.]MCX7611109.1 SDR family NAD(P)-dependent oxidoreductase [Ignavibacterium sp.]MDW8374192.1 SDR family NAD(P)-dependent oxidoreductase [Ignavibacteriales bacterium]